MELNYVTVTLYILVFYFTAYLLARWSAVAVSVTTECVPTKRYERTSLS